MTTAEESQIVAAVVAMEIETAKENPVAIGERHQLPHILVATAGGMRAAPAKMG